VRKIRVIAVVAALMASAVVALWAGLPVLAEQVVLPSLLPRVGLEDSRVRVRRIGLFGADLGPVRVGEGLSAASVHIDYTPWGLLDGRLGGLRCSGLVVPLSVSRDEISIAGLPAPERSRSSSAEPGMLPALPVDRVELTGGTVVLSHGKKTVRVPVDGVVSRESRGHPGVRASVRAWPEGQEVRVDARLDPETRTVSCTMEVPRLDPNRFADLLLPGISVVQGTFSLHGRAEVNLDDPAAAAFSATLQSRTFRLTGGPGPDVVVEPEGGGVLELSVVGQGGIFEFGLSESRVRVGPHLVGTGPVHARVSIPNGGAGTLQGNGTLCYFGSGEPFDIVPREALTLPVTVEGGWGNGDWDVRGFSAHGDNGPKAWTIKAPGRILVLHGPATELEAGGNGTGFKASGRIRMPGVDLTANGTTVRLGSLQCRGGVQRSRGQDGIVFDLDASGTAAVVNAGDFQAEVPGIRLHASGKMDDGALFLRSVLDMSRTRVVHAGSGVTLAGGSVRMPLVWPPKRAATGSFHIASVTRGGMALGAVRGSVRQTGLSLRLDGEYESAVLPGARAGFTGDVSATSRGLISEATFNLKGYRVPDAFDPASLVPALAGFDLGGVLDVSAQARLDRGVLRARAALEVAEGTVQSDDLDLNVSGIRGRLVFPDLPALRSAPDQALSFDRARIGEVVLDDARAAVQMESPGSLFLEQARFSWCGGRVFVQPLRVVPGKDAYDLVLFCDRVRLAPLLQQLGGLRARGEGAVSGRIPLAIKGKSVRFDDGFLYSSPGEGGRVELTGTEIFTAGIPPETMQYAQLDLAREALKEYDYDWVKLGFHSEEDMLLMRLQFDGRPAGPLPFVYDREFGGFARVRAGHQGSNFQGIRLDVNFRLPLDTILQYGSGAGKIFEMME
jgi:hypothetical protein